MNLSSITSEKDLNAWLTSEISYSELKSKVKISQARSFMVSSLINLYSIFSFECEIEESKFFLKIVKMGK